MSEPIPACTGLTPVFDDFLFSSIGEARNGSPVSVVSGLAQLELDPWLESAMLAELARDAAIIRLGGLIAELSDRLATKDTPRAIATRLVALLPQNERSAGPTPAARVTGRYRFDPRTAAYGILAVLAIIMSLYLFGETARRPTGFEQQPGPSSQHDSSTPNR